MIDLDLVKQTREFGTLGLSQHLKQLRDLKGGFLISGSGIAPRNVGEFKRVRESQRAEHTF